MGLNFIHLDDPAVRRRMVELWSDELAALKTSYSRSHLPYGLYLTDSGLAVFENAMPQSLAGHDDDWLAQEMRDVRYWLDKAVRRTRNGGQTLVDYDKGDALRRLTSGEFNIAYVRGLASILVDRGQTECVVYRAGSAVEPRHAYCTALEDQRVQLAQILADHRRNYFPTRDPDARPIPSGPNCHHSIRAV